MQWYADVGRTLTCCMGTSTEEQEQDPEAYDCETCERRERDEALGTMAHLALRLHGLLARTAVRDLGLAPMVFDAMNLALTEAQTLELFEMVAEVHDAARQMSADDQERADEARERKREARDAAKVTGPRVSLR